MQIQTSFHQLTVKYRGNDDIPTPDGLPLRDAPADRLRGGHAEVPHVVSKWRRLERLSPGSQEYLLLLTSILDDPMDRRATTALDGEDATVVLDILARVLDRGKNLGRLSNRTLGVLRSLAYNSSQVPNHYKIDRNLVFDVEPEPFASGGFSDVRRGKLGDRLVAVKVLRMTLDNVPEVQKHFCKETILWKNTSHPNILGLIAVEIDEYTAKYSMISELMTNGNVVSFIRSNPVNRLRLLADAADGLQYLHEHKIIHGDMKGSNILITNETSPRACLSDFGFSTLTPTTSFAISTHGMNIGGGTTPYMAPELIYPTKFGLGRSLPSKEGDIYAFGMVVYEVVTGVRPFGVENFRVEEVMYRVLDGMRPEKPENADAIGFGGGVWGLVQGCWKEDRTQRPRTEEVRQRLTVAASWSSTVPPGPMVAVQQMSTDSTLSSTHIELFNNTHQPLILTDLGGDDSEAGNGRDIRRDAGSLLELSISVARQVVDGIQASIPPTVREKFGMLDRLRLRKFIDNFRARLGFESRDTQRLHQD